MTDLRAGPFSPEIFADVRFPWNERPPSRRLLLVNTCSVRFERNRYFFDLNQICSARYIERSPGNDRHGV